MPKKKSINPLRIKRLRQEMDELNYINRVINDIVRPFRVRKERAVQAIREKLLDEGIPPDAAQVMVDDVTMEVTWEMPVQPSASPADQNGSAKKPAAKKPTRKKTPVKKR